MTAAGSGFNATKESTIAENAQDMLKHLAAATAVNQNAAKNLTSANAKFSSEFHDKNIAFVALQKSLEKLQNRLANLQASQQTPITP